MIVTGLSYRVAYNVRNQACQIRDTGPGLSGYAKRQCYYRRLNITFITNSRTSRMSENINVRESKGVRLSDTAMALDVRQDHASGLLDCGVKAIRKSLVLIVCRRLHCNESIYKQG